MFEIKPSRYACPPPRPHPAAFRCTGWLRERDSEARSWELTFPYVEDPKTLGGAIVPAGLSTRFVLPASAAQVVHWLEAENGAAVTGQVRKTGPAGPGFAKTVKGGRLLARGMQCSGCRPVVLVLLQEQRSRNARAR